jgi:hypothetical protein
MHESFDSRIKRAVRVALSIIPRGRIYNGAGLREKRRAAMTNAARDTRTDTETRGSIMSACVRTSRLPAFISSIFRTGPRRPGRGIDEECGAGGGGGGRSDGSPGSVGWGEARWRRRRRRTRDARTRTTSSGAPLLNGYVNSRGLAPVRSIRNLMHVHHAPDIKSNDCLWAFGRLLRILPFFRIFSGPSASE